jgi:hypothetical protein
MIRKLTVLLVAVLVTAGSARGDTRPHAALNAQSDPFRSDFNRDRDKVRVVMLVSPTCPECLHGAEVVQGDLFGRNASSKLAGYAIWVPKLGAHETDVAAGTTLASDPRIRHYWDASERIGTFYETMLPTPGTESWDVYMIFSPGVVWSGTTPPKPAIWMHQLPHSAPSLFLDPQKFAEDAETMLKGS